MARIGGNRNGGFWSATARKPPFQAAIVSGAAAAQLESEPPSLGVCAVQVPLVATTTNKARIADAG